MVVVSDDITQTTILKFEHPTFNGVLSSADNNSFNRVNTEETFFTLNFLWVNCVPLLCSKLLGGFQKLKM